MNRESGILVLISESGQTLYVGMALTHPLSLNECNGSELSNAKAIRPFIHMTWPS